MRLLKLFVVLCLVVLGVSFALINADPITLHYYVGECSMPLSLLLVIALGVGVLIGLSFSFWTVFRLKFKNRYLKRQLALDQKQQLKGS